MMDLRGALHEVEQRVLGGFHAVDHGERVDDPGITDDFTMSLGPTVIDADRYRAFLAARSAASYRTRHLVSNLVALAHDEASLTVGFTATVHRLEADAAEPTVTLADFVDVWVHRDGAWLHRSRSISPAFPATASAGA